MVSVDADLLQLLLVDDGLVGVLHHLPDHHLDLEAVGMARFGEERLGLGDVIGVLLRR